jgi:putative inorganic carbon (hco3(-)) transporter
MRDLLVTLLVFVGCAYSIRSAYIGILVWSWLSYMNPHRLSYGFAYTMPFSQIAALCLMVGLIFSREKKSIPMNSITIPWIIFIAYMGLTSYFAYFPDFAGDYFNRVIKIQLVSFLTIVLITDMRKLNYLIWVIVFSIGYFSVKGGLFTLLSGGSFRVWGPPDSMIEGNNEIAVATLMTVPLMVYLHQFEPRTWLKRLLVITMPLSVVAAIGTQSRGALLACGAVMFFFWIKSDKKVLMGLSSVVLVAAILVFMPSSWFERMDTIEHYEEDGSAMGRLNAWEYAFNAANHNFLGMGFDSWSLETFMLYAPDPRGVHAAHSIYFSVLADHGWLGLLLFLFIFRQAWSYLKRIIKQTDDDERFKDVNYLARMLQVSFIAYFVGGAFLSLSYFDLPWHFVSFVVLLNGYVGAQKPQTVMPTISRKPRFRSAIK